MFEILIVFSQYDKLYLWWAQNKIDGDSYRIMDTFDNQTFDSSANQYGIITLDASATNVNVDISGAIASTTYPDQGQLNTDMDDTYYGLEIKNTIVDISGISGELTGHLMPFPDSCYANIYFQSDVSLNPLNGFTDISAIDFTIEVSGNTWQGSPGWYEVPDISKNTGGYEITIGEDSLGSPIYNSIRIFLHDGGGVNFLVDNTTSECRITLKNNINKPMNRQLIDTSGNILYPTGLNTLYLTNNGVF